MYSFDSRVRYSESDERGNLSIVGLINYLQDCSTFQSEHLGIGLDHLNAMHMGWIIATWHIEISSLPRFAEPITISTWAYELRSFQAKRNFTVRRADGSDCVRADSLWFTFDLAEQKVIKVPESEYAYMDEAEPRLDMPKLVRKIKVEGPGTPGTPLVVGEQLLDTNQHVNNANYIMLAMDALGEKFTPHVIDVQYKVAATLGDTIVPVVHDDEGGHVVELASPDGTTYAIVRLKR